jgi:hypothetical protein
VQKKRALAKVAAEAMECIKVLLNPTKWPRFLESCGYDMSVIVASLILHVASCLPALPQDAEDFLSKARGLREKESWQALIDLASVEMTKGEEDQLPLAFLAIGQARLKQFPGAIASLQELVKLGVDLDAALAGLGSPMVEVVNAIYNQCWANFDPAFNRECWGPMFECFPESQYAGIAASRLLMAALKLEEADEAKRFEDYFEAQLAVARAEENAAEEAALTKRFVDGYLRAGVSDAHVMKLASLVWNVSWSEAQAMFSYDGPTTGGNLTSEQLLARRECELETDHAFNTIAQATQLAGVTIEAGHPLFDMESAPSVTFANVTEKVGLSGIKETRVAAADFDNDGDADLCFGGRLFENRKGRFVEVGKELGITHKGSGAVFGDYNGDGNLDLLIAASPRPFLYRNLGKRGKYAFEDISATCGFASVKVDAGVEGIAWADFDDDGDLDIYLGVYEAGGSGHPDALLENLGGGKFQEVSAEKGVHDVGPFCGRGISPADIDGDGDTEIFVSNYRLEQNLFWQWDGSKLVDGSEAAGIKGVREPADENYYGHTIGSCWGDVDNDGDLDLFSANLAHPRFVRQGFSNMSLLGINQGDGTFSSESMARGIRFQETHSDPAFVDIDNDGDLDLSITCVYEGVASALYQNDGAGNFSPITFRSGAAMFHGWGQAWLDINGDGFLDVVYGSSNGLVVLENSGNENHFIRVALECKGKDSSAFGAIVQVETMEAEVPQTWTRQLLNARGTGSQDEAILQFGLGTYEGRVKVSVRWPDSDRTESKTPSPDRVYVIKQNRKAK